MRKKALFILIPLAAAAAGIFGFFYYVNSHIYVPDNKQTAVTQQTEAGQKEEVSGITNILLIGLDGRNNDADSRTDSIILATIDTNNKRLKLTSFMRDMYVPIPGHGQGRINTAYFFGGPNLLIKTLNQDFNMDIQYYMSIDFRAFQDLVEKVGGVDVEVKDYEVKEINKYIQEVNGSNSKLLNGPGYQHLNGQQALSYCRIRKVGNGDYERTERQRKLLSVLAKKVKTVGVIKLPQLFASVIPYVKTNVPAAKLMGIGYTGYKYTSSPIQTMRIPMDGMFQEMIINGADVLVPDIEKNVTALDRFVNTDAGAVISNMPVYMANNYHEDDKPIDKRGQKKKTVTIVIPKNVVETNSSEVNNTDSNNENNGEQNQNIDENSGQTATP